MNNLAASIGKREGWKYTPLFALAQKSWPADEIQCVCSAPLQKLDVFPRIDFDNDGDQIIADTILSQASPRQIILGGTSTADIDTHIFYTLEDAQAYSALAIHVTGDQPFTITEKVITKNAQYNALQFIQVNEGAQLLHIRVMDTDDKSIVFAPVHVQVGQGGTYTQILMSRGAELSRYTVQGELQGKNAYIDLRGVHRLHDMRHVDQSIFMRHMVPYCTSNQSIRYIVDGEASGAFQGKIHVARDAQKTAAYQLCKSLLLSERAQINTKPELEIYADDVKCSHGATIGALDQKAMFYMQSRGVPKAEAEALLMEAFVEDAFDGLDIAPNIRAFII